MAILYPAALDALENPTEFDNNKTFIVPHYQQHSDANDAIEALEAKVGVDNSAVTTSLDYRVRAMESGGVSAKLFGGTIVGHPTGPNGQVTAKGPAIYFNDVPNLWIKYDTTESNTGWIQIV